MKAKKLFLITILILLILITGCSKNNYNNNFQEENKPQEATRPIIQVQEKITTTKNVETQVFLTIRNIYNKEEIFTIQPFQQQFFEEKNITIKGHEETRVPINILIKESGEFIQQIKVIDSKNNAYAFTNFKIISIEG